MVDFESALCRGKRFRVKGFGFSWVRCGNTSCLRQVCSIVLRLKNDCSVGPTENGCLTFLVHRVSCKKC